MTQLMELLTQHTARAPPAKTTAVAEVLERLRTLAIAPIIYTQDIANDNIFNFDAGHDLRTLDPNHLVMADDETYTERWRIIQPATEQSQISTALSAFIKKHYKTYDHVRVVIVRCLLPRPDIFNFLCQHVAAFAKIREEVGNDRNGSPRLREVVLRMSEADQAWFSRCVHELSGLRQGTTSNDHEYHMVIVYEKFTPMNIEDLCIM
jgi:hypothetical protein